MRPPSEDWRQGGIGRLQLEMLTPRSAVTDAAGGVADGPVDDAVGSSPAMPAVYAV